MKRLFKVLPVLTILFSSFSCASNNEKYSLTFINEVGDDLIVKNNIKNGKYQEGKEFKITFKNVLDVEGFLYMNNNAINFKRESNGDKTYTFKMPAYDIEVLASTDCYFGNQTFDFNYFYHIPTDLKSDDVKEINIFKGSPIGVHLEKIEGTTTTINDKNYIKEVLSWMNEVKFKKVEVSKYDEYSSVELILTNGETYNFDFYDGKALLVDFSKGPILFEPTIPFPEFK